MNLRSSTCSHGGRAALVRLRRIGWIGPRKLCLRGGLASVYPWVSRRERLGTAHFRARRWILAEDGWGGGAVLARWAEKVVWSPYAPLRLQGSHEPLPPIPTTRTRPFIAYARRTRVSRRRARGGWWRTPSSSMRSPPACYPSPSTPTPGPDARAFARVHVASSVRAGHREGARAARAARLCSGQGTGGGQARGLRGRCAVSRTICTSRRPTRWPRRSSSCSTSRLAEVERRCPRFQCVRLLPRPPQRARHRPIQPSTASAIVPLRATRAMPQGEAASAWTTAALASAR